MRESASAGARRKPRRNLASEPYAELDRSVVERNGLGTLLDVDSMAGALQHCHDRESGDIRHREVASLRVRPERRSQIAKVDGGQDSFAVAASAPLRRVPSWSRATPRVQGGQSPASADP